jgi:hypothetical protein
MGEDGKSSRRGDDFPRLQAAGVCAFRSHAYLRRPALYHLTDTGREFVEEVDSRVPADRRTKIDEARGGGSRPIWTVGGMDSDRSQRSEEIGTVQPALPGLIPCNKICAKQHS